MGYDFFENFFVLCHGAKVAIKKETDKWRRRDGEGATGRGAKRERSAMQKGTDQASG
jgi:SH3-like domain-containing protein